MVARLARGCRQWALHRRCITSSLLSLSAIRPNLTNSRATPSSFPSSFLKVALQTTFHYRSFSTLPAVDGVGDEEPHRGDDAETASESGSLAAARPAAGADLSCTVRVHELPAEVTEAALRELAARFGSVRTCSVLPDTRQAVIEFERAEEAAALLSQHSTRPAVLSGASHQLWLVAGNAPAVSWEAETEGEDPVWDCDYDIERMDAYMQLLTRCRQQGRYDQLLILIQSWPFGEQPRRRLQRFARFVCHRLILQQRAWRLRDEQSAVQQSPYYADYTALIHCVQRYAELDAKRDRPYYHEAVIELHRAFEQPESALDHLHHYVPQTGHVVIACSALSVLMLDFAQRREARRVLELHQLLQELSRHRPQLSVVQHRALVARVLIANSREEVEDAMHEARQLMLRQGMVDLQLATAVERLVLTPRWSQLACVQDVWQICTGGLAVPEPFASIADTKVKRAEAWLHDRMVKHRLQQEAQGH